MITCLDCHITYKSTDEVELIEKNGICPECREKRKEIARKIDAQIVPMPKVRFEVPKMDMRYDKDQFINARDLMGFYGKGFRGK